LMFWLYRARSTVVARMFMIAVFAIFGLSVGLSIFPEAGSRLLERFRGITTPAADENASWRIKRWEHHTNRLLKDERKLWFGEGLGGYSRDSRTRELLSNPHNAYIQLVLKFGLLGGLVYSLMAFDFFRKNLAARKKLRPGPMRAYIEVAIMSFAAAHAYALGYNFMPVMLMFFAMATSAVNLSQHALRLSRDSRISSFPEDLGIPPRQFRPHTRPEARPVYS
jgi:O-antigen ligase